MTTSIDPIPTTTTSSMRRQIGPIGTVGRVVLGIVFLAGAVSLGVGWVDVLVGIFAANAVVFCVMSARGADAPPLRFTGVGGHLANFAIGIPFVSLFPEAGLLFFGSAMLLAAVRGFAACEMFAVWNLLRGRDDRIGCPVFSPIDYAEERITGHPREC